MITFRSLFKVPCISTVITDRENRHAIICKIYQNNNFHLLICCIDLMVFSSDMDIAGKLRIIEKYVFFFIICVEDPCNS